MRAGILFLGDTEGLWFADGTNNGESRLRFVGDSSDIRNRFLADVRCLPEIATDPYTVRTPAAFDPTSNPAVVVVSALRTWFAVADSSALWLCVSCHAAISGYAWDDNDCSNLEQFNISVAA